MGKDDDETPLSNLDDAFAALAGTESVPQERSIFEQVSTIPPEGPLGEDPQPKEAHIAPFEEMHLEFELLGNSTREIRRGAADALISIAENEDCTAINARRILDALLFRNREHKGEFDSHVRKARKCLEDIITLGPTRDTLPPKRTTWPTGNQIAPIGQPIQGPVKPVVDTTAKIRKTTPKR
ncbi:MAG: hypothetical protein GY852_07030 [bacterium]|nr:hypothetical protein [bacterium]